jgi:hypothetical protein
LPIHELELRFNSRTLSWQNGGAMSILICRKKNDGAGAENDQRFFALLRMTAIFAEPDKSQVPMGKSEIN